MIEDLFDKSDRKLDELTENLRATYQRVESLEQDARQPRLTMEVDLPADTTTRERTEGAAKEVQSMHGDSFSANRVDLAPMCSTSFGVKAKPPALPCRDDVLVESGAAAPESSLTLENVLINSRRLLTPRRRGLCSDENHFLPAASLILPDRR